ncbi:MAG TPA: DUF3990 domain-containing protein [Candidatus Rifleibacterium sp.]|nr:DUF3990 domain-containing protein [Candidatus Rifleibacterium sp.]
MIIYHGSNMPVSKPEIRKARFSKDFGTGFYCTEILEQTERWTRRFDSPIVSHYEYRETQGLNILKFPEMTEEWLDFIAGILTREQFWVLAKFKHPTHQIAMCTERALNAISFLKAEEVRP